MKEKKFLVTWKSRQTYQGSGYIVAKTPAEARRKARLSIVNGEFDDGDPDRVEDVSHEYMDGSANVVSSFVAHELEVDENDQS